MIKANELRIGNWVFKENRRVQLNEDDLEVLFAARNYEDYNPIQLTAEILMNCGFEKIIGSSRFYKIDVLFKSTEKRLLEVGLYAQNSACLRSYTKEMKEKGQHNFIELISSRSGKPCKIYLHQLQNLYFALTGKELKVTL